jgi:glutathione-regulated potassium-efflux system ancillary protein KefC
VNGALIEVVALLSAAVIFVPIAQRVGLGSVMGYLIAGIVIGPFGLKVVGEAKYLADVSELGVVFLMFLIGLELQPQRLWSWRVPIFAMGGVQVLLVTALVTLLGLALGYPWNTSLVLGMACAMSSTAIASQILKERGALSSFSGSSAFSILLFQDIAVIAILALLPMIAGRSSSSEASVPTWEILLVIVTVIAIGRYLLRHVFRMVAAAKLREVFTALSLLIVFGLAWLMHHLGLSMALGAFMGGVLLATSEYRHAVEVDIEPFKGLLLGLFFMNVGLSVDFATVSNQLGLLAFLLVAVLTLKIFAHAIVARLFKMRPQEIPFFAISIAQVGEFAFVLAAAARTMGMMDVEQVAVLSAVVGGSMALTPLMLKGLDRWMLTKNRGAGQKPHDQIEDSHPEVIIAGFGRVGQIVGRILFANRIRATVMDQDPEQVESLRRFGFQVYYGNATRLDLLEAAGARTAKLIVIAVDNFDAVVRIVELVKEHFPHLKIVARARNIAQVYKLIDLKVNVWERETFESSLKLGTEVLRELGWSPYRAARAGNTFRRHNIRLINEMHKMRDNQRDVISAVKQSRADLEKMFIGEERLLGRSEEGWDLDVHPEGRS